MSETRESGGLSLEYVECGLSELAARSDIDELLTEIRNIAALECPESAMTRIALKVGTVRAMSLAMRFELEELRRQVQRYEDRRNER